MTLYKNLEVWKTAMILVSRVYELVASFPKEEIYGISSQIKRAAVSIPANIAEGCGRQYKKDTRHFLHIARGSLYELETLLDISVRINILEEKKYESLVPLIDEDLKILNGLIRHYEQEALK